MLNHSTNQLLDSPFLDSRLCFQLNELNELNELITHHRSSTSGYRIKSGMTECIVIPADPGSGSRADVVIPANAGIQRDGGSMLLRVVRPFVASGLAPDVRGNVAHKVRRYTDLQSSGRKAVISNQLSAISSCFLLNHLTPQLPLPANSTNPTNSMNPTNPCYQ